MSAYSDELFEIIQDHSNEIETDWELELGNIVGAAQAWLDWEEGSRADRLEDWEEDVRAIRVLALNIVEQEASLAEVSEWGTLVDQLTRRMEADQERMEEEEEDDDDEEDDDED